MKKRILAVVTTFTLVASGASGATYTDADASGTWTSALVFNGTITNTKPVWRYKITDEAITGATDWDLDLTSGIPSSEGNTEFKTTKAFRILEGVMKNPSDYGGVGMQPVIVFGEPGKEKVWDTSSSLPQPILLQLTAKNGATPVGVLRVVLVGQAAMQFFDAEAPCPGTTGRGDTWQKVPDAIALLKTQPYYNSTYNQYKPVHDSHGDTTEALSDRRLEKVSAALVATAKNIELSVPTASIPDSWSATLPISITVK